MMHTHIHAAALAAALSATCALGAYAPPVQPRLARALSDGQVRSLVEGVPASSMVRVPAGYVSLSESERAVATNGLASAAIRYLAPVLADTRSHIPEAAGLSDVEVALLYLAQMAKDADALRAVAPTNTIEYLVGAGMRLDLISATNAPSGD